jgi:acetoacetyl-CoA synthetase
MIAMLALRPLAQSEQSAPRFGSDGALDRLKQLSPKLLFCCDGYQYGGRVFDRRNEVTKIITHLEELEHVVYLPRLNSNNHPTFLSAILWNELLIPFQGQADHL